MDDPNSVEPPAAPTTPPPSPLAVEGPGVRGRAAPAVGGRLLAIGDIHGCQIAFDTLLKHLAITPADTVVVLGDVIDRGPGTRQVIDRLIELRNQCRLIFVLGNHEEMFLDSLTVEDVREPWMGFGGLETLISYGEHAEDTGELPPEHVAFLKSGLDYFETESTIFVHANLEPGKPLAEQTAEWLRWAKLTRRERPLPSGQRVICGHTAQKSGQVWIGDGWVCIDTFAYGGMFLTALDVGHELVYQARQSGEFLGPTPLGPRSSP
jgi:serine/threonine protein phosphatase 1